ncbi:hypothetical protein [Mycoplasma suis]|uniref:Uncharacterized protein n=1 Tax=Mycoplasma suis (strain Illinois) TaxID=768700 RepID=F0QRH8_MYCSL|nr:hypothetical protein [Mycoplasma suis]ADX98098.1 hypothetical protein MSU_0565 [Mycoplasma suis str. Illinois]
MTKKLIYSFVGVSGIFGASLKFHVLGDHSGNIRNNSSSKKSNYFQQVSKDLEKTELKKTNYSGERRSLGGSHFGSWKYQSEGSTEDIYLVTKDNVVKKIKASNYGQKARVLKDGILIDRNNLWFGKRDISNKFERDEKEIKGKQEVIQKYKNSVQSSFNEEEMKLLGKWWEELREDQQCEILEIFVECDTIRRSLGKGGRITWIDDGLKIKPEQLIYLGRTKRRFPLLKEIIGNGKLIHLPQKGEIGILAGEAIDNWIEEYLENKHVESENKGGVNLISLGEKLMRGEEAYKKCNSLEEKDDLYLECSDPIKEVSIKESSIEGESVILPRIQGVIKAGVTSGSRDIKVSSKNQKSNSWRLAEKEEFKDNQKSKQIFDSLKKNGRDGGIIDVECKQFELSIWNFFSSTSLGKQQGCEAAWKVIFKEEEIDQKRLCLFKIPEAKHYVREYKISFLSLSSWYKNDQFWTKCSEYGL